VCNGIWQLILKENACFSKSIFSKHKKQNKNILWKQRNKDQNSKNNKTTIESLYESGT
jgi:hypothetical protein